MGFNENDVNREHDGRFGEKAHSSPTVVLPHPREWDGPRPNDFPVPQANDLEKLGAGIDAIAAGADTPAAVAQVLGLNDDRVGAYYADALGYLGFVTKRKDNSGLAGYELTALGEEYNGEPDSATKTGLVRAAVEESDVIQAYRVGRVEELRGEYTDSTWDRRLACAQSWENKLSDPYLEAESRQATERVRELAPAVAAAVKVEREARVRASQPKQRALCPDCFQEMPNSGVCDFC